MGASSGGDTVFVLNVWNTGAKLIEHQFLVVAPRKMSAISATQQSDFDVAISEPPGQVCDERSLTSAASRDIANADYWNRRTVNAFVTSVEELVANPNSTTIKRRSD